MCRARGQGCGRFQGEDTRMTFRFKRIVWAAVAVVCMSGGGAFAQTGGNRNGLGGLDNLTDEQISMIESLLGGALGGGSLTDLLGGLGGGSLTDLLGGLTGNGTGEEAPATQPSGRPSAFITRGILQHQQFNNNAFNLTPEERRENLPDPPFEFKLPIALIIPALANWLGETIPALGFLADLFDGFTPAPNPGTGPTPPAGLTGLGPVAFVTADDTSLRVGETTTGRLWVQQSSPNEAGDNGIFSVAVNITAVPPGIVEAQVPVTILQTWSNPGTPAKTGTATTAGGIDEVTAGISPTNAVRTQGISGPVQVFHFQIKAVGPGTVTLSPTNVMTGGFKGVLDYAGQSGNEANYVSVQITVTR